MENFSVIDGKIYAELDTDSRKEWEEVELKAKELGLSLMLVNTKVQVSQTEFTEVILIGIMKGVHVLLQSQDRFGHKAVKKMKEFFASHTIKLY
jgi:hypothetical protein